MAGLDRENKQVALVTGGAGGIGRAVAQKLAETGAITVIVDKNAQAVEQIAEEIGVKPLVADLTDQAACRQVVDQIASDFGDITILVNNAGFQHVAPIDSFPPDVWDEMLALMLTAPFLLTKHVWEGMKHHGWGRIVNMASIHSQIASPYKAGYTAAKHGLVGLTKTAALEGGPLGITVNAISPAYVRTTLVEKQIAEQAKVHGISEEEVLEKVMLEPAAIKRLIEPDEVAALVMYLCSDAANSITGSNWTMDGGWTAR